MAKKKVKAPKLQFNDVNDDASFARYDAEFHPTEDFDVYEAVEEQLKWCWNSIASVAREGFNKVGRGYVYIGPNFCSAELAARRDFHGLEVEYMAEYDPRSLFLFRDVSRLPEYNAETEVVFFIDFNDGYMDGVASLGKPLEQMQTAA